MAVLNVHLDKFLRKTLWLWLPFFALNKLIREFIEKKIR